MGLADADSQAVLTFARHWGPLGLCEHGRPFQHGELPYGADRWPRLCGPRQIQQGAKTYFVEPLNAWSDLTRAAQALYETVYRLRNHQPARTRDVQVLLQTRFGIGKAARHFQALAGDGEKPGRARRDAWFLVGERLNDWLVGAPVRFFCEIDEGSGRFDLDFGVGYAGIFPIIAAQLLATLSDPQRGKAIICSGCGLPFIQVREPSTGKRRYCLACRRAHIPVRDAVRKSRQSKKIVKPFNTLPTAAD